MKSSLVSFVTLGTPHRPLALLISLIDGLIEIREMNIIHDDIENSITVPVGRVI